MRDPRSSQPVAKQAAPLIGFELVIPTLQPCYHATHTGMPTYSVESVHSQGLEQPAVIGPDQPTDVSVRVFSRRKASDPQQQPIKGRPPMHINRNTIDTLFGQPQAQAAQHLGISVTAFKQTCRKLGVMRWPNCGKKCNRMQNAQRDSLNVRDSVVTQAYHLRPALQWVASTDDEMALPQHVISTHVPDIADAREIQPSFAAQDTNTDNIDDVLEKESAATQGTYLHWDGWISARPQALQENEKVSRQKPHVHFEAQ